MPIGHDDGGLLRLSAMECLTSLDDRFGRLQRRAAKLNRQLGGDGWESWDTPPTKPKWMRWRTYERKYERWERVVEKASDEFMTRARRLKLI